MCSGTQAKRREQQAFAIDGIRTTNKKRKKGKKICTIKKKSFAPKMCQKPTSPRLGAFWIVTFFVAFAQSVAATEFSAACAGGYHACVIRDDRSTVCWGDNEYGQLGLDHDYAIGDGYDHTMELNRRLLETELGDELVAVDLGTDGSGNNLTAKSLSCGHEHTCALLSDDTLKCWGANWDGQLGLDHDYDIGDGDDHNDHTMKLNRRLLTEMGDELPAVFLGTDGSGNNLTAKSVSCGYVSTCAVLSDDTLKCWGSDYEGILGEKTTFDEDGNRIDYTFGDEKGDMAALGIVNLGTDRTVLNVFLSHDSYSVCAILDDYSFKCWGGDAESGKLGNETAARNGDYIGDGLTRDEDGKWVVLDENETEMGDRLIAVNLGTGHTVYKLICSLNEYVENNVCTACPPRTTNAAGDEATGADTTCDVILCAVNEYVESNVCTACPAGTSNAAGDDATGADTTCEVGSQMMAAMEQAQASKASMLSDVTDPDALKLATVAAEAALDGVMVTKLDMAIPAESSDQACDAAFTTMDIDPDLGACELSATSRRRHLTNDAFDVSVYIASETATATARDNLETAGVDVAVTELEPMAILETIPEIEPDALHMFETDVQAYVDAEEELSESGARPDATCALFVMSALIAAASVFA